VDSEQGEAKRHLPFEKYNRQKNQSKRRSAVKVETNVLQLREIFNKIDQSPQKLYKMIRFAIQDGLGGIVWSVIVK